jgi:hypothetical protein
LTVSVRLPPDNEIVRLEFTRNERGDRKRALGRARAQRRKQRPEKPKKQHVCKKRTGIDRGKKTRKKKIKKKEKKKKNTNKQFLRHASLSKFCGVNPDGLLNPRIEVRSSTAAPEISQKEKRKKKKKNKKKKKKKKARPSKMRFPLLALALLAAAALLLPAAHCARTVAVALAAPFPRAPAVLEGLGAAGAVLGRAAHWALVDAVAVAHWARARDAAGEVFPPHRGDGQWVPQRRDFDCFIIIIAIIINYCSLPVAVAGLGLGLGLGVELVLGWLGVCAFGVCCSFVHPGAEYDLAFGFCLRVGVSCRVHFLARVVTMRAGLSRWWLVDECDLTLS